MKVRIARLTVPELEFGGSAFYADPRKGLQEAGPFDLRFGSAHRAQIRVGVVGNQEMCASVAAWLTRCMSLIPAENSQGMQLPFPGFQTVYRSELVADPAWRVVLDNSRLQTAVGMRPYEGFEQAVQLYATAIAQLKEDHRPDLIMCGIPDAIEKRFWSVQRLVTQVERKNLAATARRAESAQLELPLDWEPEEAPEDLLRRDFRRALKAHAMRIGIPIQLARASLLVDSTRNEEAAARAWNSTVGMYYKAGGIPWRSRARGPETCFVGITFHHLRTTRRAIVHSSLAQAFSTNGGGFALRGSIVAPDPNDPRRTPHMTAEQALQLGCRVLREYEARNGVPPKRIVLHKSSRFWREEQEGFEQAFKGVPVVQLITLAPSSVRLVTHASYPPSRGTLLSIEDARHFLFTSGYVPELGTYPGPHIPIPVEIAVHGDADYADIKDAAMDALGLGRLNWNTTDLRSSQPVTLGFARRVGGVMAEYGQLSDDDPDPNYRYYM